MSGPLKLATSREAFNDLALALDKTRIDGKLVTINKETLRTLLRDHAKVIAALHDAGTETEDAPDGNAVNEVAAA